jgi:hypothetical protein
MTTSNDPALPATSTAPVLPPVSQPFICVDDAALWLHQHERVSDREYGALLLQRPDGNYVATTPLTGETNTFDLERLLAYDRQTRTITHPAGYLCVGRYHSHPEYAEQTARAHPRYSEDQVKLFQALPSTVDLGSAFRHVDVFRTNYISSHDGSLVAYSINPQNAAGNPQLGLGSTPESRIKRIVTIGQMRVLDPGTVWGGFRGPITTQWTPNQPVIPGPPTLQPFHTSVFDDPASALNAALSRVPAIAAHLRMGLILKHRDRDEYVATLPFHRPDGLLAIEQVFPTMPAGFLLPENQTLAGVYLGPELLATQLPEEQADIYQQFFSPRSLLFSLHQGRTSGLVDASRGFSVFRQTQDGALLKYHSTFSDAESLMLEADGKMGVNIDRFLLTGRMSARFFVRRVAAMGVLTVEQTSPFWDVSGAVDARWRPYGRA